MCWRGERVLIGSRWHAGCEAVLLGVQKPGMLRLTSIVEVVGLLFPLRIPELLERWSLGSGREGLVLLCLGRCFSR